MKCSECEKTLGALDDFQEGLNAEIILTLESISTAFEALKKYVKEIHGEEKTLEKRCCQCDATTTPQWRTYDNRIYCNACGIRYYRTVK